MSHKVSKLTDDAQTLAGILLVAEAWAHVPRKSPPDGRIIDPGIVEREVKRLLLEMQADEEEPENVQVEPTGPARFPQ